MRSSRRSAAGSAVGPAYVALAVPANSALGLDAGVSVVELETRGVIAQSATTMAEWDGDAADVELTALGFVRTHPWHDSGGQWAARVEPASR